MTAHIGITGTRNGGTIQQLSRARLILAAEWEAGATLHHGRCVGSDQEVHHIARELEYVIEQHPPQNRAMESLDCEVLPGEILHARLPYMDRNRAIVDAVSQLIVIPEHPEHDPRSARSGSWATYRYALRQGIAVHPLCPDDWITTR